MLDERHAACRIGGGESVEQRGDLVRVGEAEQIGHLLLRHRTVTERCDLIEDAFGVAQRTRGVPRDRFERGVLAAEAFAGADRAQRLDDEAVRYAPQVEALRARHDRRRDLVCLGRREHEDDVRGRLLQGLQQSIERVARELMDLVDDVDLVCAARRSEADLLAKVTDVVDGAVACGIDLDQVEKASVADGDAVLALVAGLAVLRTQAVHGLGDEPRRRGLARPARTGQEVGVGDLTVSDRVSQRSGDRLLPDQLSEGLRAVAQIEGASLRHPSPSREGSCTLR